MSIATAVRSYKWIADSPRAGAVSWRRVHSTPDRRAGRRAAAASGSPQCGRRRASSGGLLADRQSLLALLGGVLGVSPAASLQVDRRGAARARAIPGGRRGNNGTFSYSLISVQLRISGF